MNRTCYKVCLQRERVVQEGYNSSATCLQRSRVVEEEFISAVGNELPTEFVLKYKIGQKTVPEIGRIFVFDHFEHAKSFMYSLGRRFDACPIRVIFEGLAEKWGVPKYLVDSYKNIGDMNSFWLDKKQHKRIGRIISRGPPKGSLTCKAFTPLKEVYRHQY